MKALAMAALFEQQPGERGLPILSSFFRLLVLLSPTALLLAAALRNHGTSLILWLAVGCQALVIGLNLLGRQNWHSPTGATVILLYLLGLAGMWWGDNINDWFNSGAKAVLLTIPLVVFGWQTFTDSGAPAIRRAHKLAQRVAQRQEWPADLASCRTLPEVKALRAALSMDASPALALLHHKRPEVRVAALAALEFRKDWRPGHAELVLQFAQRAEQPAVRAAAVTALGNLDDRTVVETVSQFLHDPSWEVRKAAAEALLWDTETRWPWIRFAVRRFLADPLYQNDGSLWHEGQLLNAEAVKDLTAWCAEKGVLALRAAQTLGAHYGRAMTERGDQRLVKNLREQLGDPHTPACLRIELARLLQHHKELDKPLLERMLDPGNPAPLRLVAIETVLAAEMEGAVYASAVAALRDLARLPNRELALSTADVIQRRLGVDLGLALGQELPAVHSRQAADVTRRVMAWAVQYDKVEDVEDSRPLATKRG
jgi:HEAT repeat protein